METRLPDCPHALAAEEGQFWCETAGEWFAVSGLECQRCRAGLPVTTEAYREWIREDESHGCLRRAKSANPSDRL